MRNFLFSVVAVVLSATVANAQTEQPKPNQLSEVYGAWTVRCQKNSDTESLGQCEITQERRQSESNQLVVALSFRALSGDGAQVLVIAPFGLRLSEGVRYLDKDGATIWSGPFQTCLPTGCISVPQLTADEMTAVLSTDAPQISFVANDGKPLSVQIDVNGLSDAWKRLNTLKAEN